MRAFITIIGFCVLTVCSTAQNWKLVWSDEFSGTGLPDNTKWSFDTQGNEWDWGNQESQNYTPASQNNAWLENGNLVIEARKEKYTWPGDNQQREYTSARLRTINKGDWLYGKVEVRALLPTGRGMWPAIWMLPTDEAYGGWPKSGEIDIMENVGYEPNKIVCTAHSEAYNFTIGNQISNNKIVDDPHLNWHVYSMEWSASKIDLFVDGVVVLSYTNPKNGSASWPFDKRFHLLLNIAVGGSWGGKQDIDDAIFPQRMQVDYVRVYEASTAPVAQIPYKNAIHTIPGTVEAEDFDEGGLGIAYSDDSQANQGGTYREQESVDIGGTPATGYSIGWFNTNEWVEYTCQVAEDGIFRADILASTMNANSTGHLEIAGTSLGGNLSVSNTGGWQSWQSFSTETFALSAGTYVVRLVCDGQSFNVDKIVFRPIITQEIQLNKGWNLFSTNINTADSTIITLFNGLDALEIKTMDAFWRKGQAEFLNGFETISAGKGYMVNMNNEGILKITGIPMLNANVYISNAGVLQLIGCPNQTSLLVDDVSPSNLLWVKDFEGFYLPNSTQNSFDSFEPGNAYFVKCE